MIPALSTSELEPSYLQSSPSFHKKAPLAGTVHNSLSSNVKSKSMASAAEALLFENRAQLKILTSRIAMHLSDAIRRDLFSQIDFLLDAEDWSEADKLVDARSFRTLLRFAIYYGPIKRPSLTVSDRRYITASWLDGRNRLTIEFMNNDHVRAVVYRFQGYGGEPEVWSYLGRTEGMRQMLVQTGTAGWCISEAT